MIYDEDYEKAEIAYNAYINKGREVAKENDMRLSKFKKEISLGLSTINNEDQWTFDYQSYLYELSNGIYESPTQWAERYYFSRWFLKS